MRWSQPGLNRATLLYVDGHLVVLTEYGKLLLVRATPERFDAVAASDLRQPDGHPLCATRRGERRSWPTDCST